MSTIDAYLGAALQAVALLRKPEIAAAWEQPSALAAVTVSELADHLAYQIFSVDSALEGPASEHAPIGLLEHYARVTWIGAPPGGEANAGTQARGDGIGSEGPQSLQERASAALAEQQAKLPGRSRDQTVPVPQAGWALRLDDFLITRIRGSPLERSRRASTARCCGHESRPQQDLVVTPVKWRPLTRIMELAVHMDDLTVSVGLAAQELPDTVFDPALVLLARLAVRRHGQPALLRALARAERAPAAINAI